MQMWASFLNNSSSRWEPIFDDWRFSVALMDHISPIYRSDFMRHAPPHPPPPPLPFLKTMCVVWGHMAGP